MPYIVQSDSQQLAYRLVHAAFFESNAEAAHILLVTALEAIIDKKKGKRQADVRELVNWLKQEVKDTLDQSHQHRQALLDALEREKRESINGAGQRLAQTYLAGEYDGLASNDFFKKVYDQRSNLVLCGEL